MPILKEKHSWIFILIVNLELLARAVSNIIDFPNASLSNRFAGGRVSLMEFVVKDSSGPCQCQSQISRKKFGNVIVCAMERSSTDDSKQ